MIAVIASSLLTTGCDSETLGRQLPPHRFRFTAYVDTPDGVRVGSSVMEVQWNLPGKIWGTQGISTAVLKGQAVIVDLPRNQKLFVLLGGDGDPDWISYNAYGPYAVLPVERVDPREFPIRRSTYAHGRTVSNYPFLVRFRDLANPRTIEEVDPDALDKSFGSGVRLKALTVQATDADITRGIETLLPWLRDWRIGFFDPKRDSHGGLLPPETFTVAHKIDYRYFSRGLQDEP